LAEVLIPQILLLNEVVKIITQMNQDVLNKMNDLKTKIVTNEQQFDEQLNKEYSKIKNKISNRFLDKFISVRLRFCSSVVSLSLDPSCKYIVV